MIVENFGNLFKNKTTTVIFIIAVITSITIVVTLALNWGIKARQNRISAQKQSFKAPTSTQKREIKKIRMKHINDEGQEEYIEITQSGEINVYDSRNQLVRAQLQGYARITLLFNKINRHLSQSSPTELAELQNNNSGELQCYIQISTNLGEFTISCDEVIDIKKDIDQIEEETFHPTPTPTPPPTIASPTATIPPTSPTVVSPSPSNAPGGPSPTPTPLPDYMTAPPFSCEEYQSLGRPVAISNIVCGID